MATPDRDPSRESFRPGRREFLAGAAALAVAGVARSPRPAAAAAPEGKIPLGMDNFSVRSWGWKAPELIDYAAGLGLDVLLLSDLDVYESFDEAYLKSLRERADAAGLRLHAGTGSVCPTSRTFNDRRGSAAEHLALTIRVAKAIGSPVARCYLGNGGDRTTDGGIERHVESTVKTFREARSLAVDSGVKIAIENHAGDLQARELAALVEAAGTDFVGVTMDSGNATWTLEDPLASMEILAPYAASSGMRDSAVWEDENGVAQVAWTAMGEGVVDWSAYMARWRELRPACPFVLEIISTGPRGFDWLGGGPEFWNAWPEMRAIDLARFAALARKGRPYTPPEGPTGPTPEETTRLRQKDDLERSLRFCREKLGLGTRGAA